MNSLCKYLAIGFKTKTECEVVSIKRSTSQKWWLISSKDEDLGLYDLIISTAPAPQAVKLFGEFIPKKMKFLTQHLTVVLL